MIFLSDPEARASLARSVEISLLSWRLAAPDDDVDNGRRYGYWGDAFPPKAGALVGSRLWLLRRAKLITRETLVKAEEYIREALQWMLDDSVVSKIDVELKRHENDGIQGVITLTLADGGRLAVPYNDLWRINHGI